VKFKTI